MSYLKLSTMEYPLFEGDIRLEHPEISEFQTGDTFPCPENFVKVKEIEHPNFDASQNQYVKEQMPQQIDGVWTQVFSVETYTAEELKQIEEFKKMQRAKSMPSIPDTSGSGSAPNVVA